jgi:hypothetical protein
MHLPTLQEHLHTYTHHLQRMDINSITYSSIKATTNSNNNKDHL